MSEEIEDVEVDAFLESDESVDDLLKSEYGASEPDDTFYDDLQPVADVREEEPEVDASPDKRLIRGKGIALTNLDTDGVTLDEEISKEEEMVATRNRDKFSDPALNAVYKSSTKHRAARERAEMDKRELLDLAGEMVDDYFRKNVQTDGIDDARLNQLKFAARRRVARTLAED